MRVFVTGATGFVGSAVVNELIKAGHQVLGLTRSDAGARALEAAGAQAHYGDLEDFDSLKSGVAATDAVIHTGFIHDFARFKEVCEIDRQVITFIGNELKGTGRPFIITSGIGILLLDHIATEADEPSADSPNPRVATEQAAEAVAALGVKVAVVRLPPTVHGEGDHGFIPMIMDIDQQKGVSVYKDNGANRWPAVHRLDAAKLYRLAVEQAPDHYVRYHAIAEEGITFKEIATAIGQGLNLPVESRSAEQTAEHFTWFAHFAGTDWPASSEQTQRQLGWQPTEVGLLDDLAQGHYFSKAK